MTVFLFVLLPEIPEDGNCGRADIHTIDYSCRSQKFSNFETQLTCIACDWGIKWGKM